MKVDGIENLAELVLGEMRDMDVVLADALQRNNIDVSCGACAHPGCCYQTTLVFLAEGLAITQTMLDQGKLTPQVLEACASAGVVMESKSRGEFFNTATPCVFLKDNKCSIYDVRPSCCRKYHVVTPPQLCRPPSGVKVGMVNTSRMDEHWINNMLAIQHAMGFRIPPVMWCSLPRMIHVCAQALAMNTEVEFKRFLSSQLWVKPIGKMVPL